MAYPNLILAFKLLRNSCLGLEANFSVFSELRTCEKSSADFLAKTLNCLNEIMVEQFSKAEKQEVTHENGHRTIVCILKIKRRIIVKCTRLFTLTLCGHTNYGCF